MSLFSRLGKIVQSEWNHRFGEGGHTDSDDLHASRADSAAASPRASRALTVDGALRTLGFQEMPPLAEVRARYQEMARRYHPRTLSPDGAQAHAAEVVLDSLTAALELLEEHALPWRHPS